MRVLFALALLSTVACLLTPASAILISKNWIASWLPLAAVLDAADAGAHADKLVHAGLFGTLGFLAACAWLTAGERRAMALALLLVGVATELLQGLVTGREPSMSDWIADALGVMLGMVGALCVPVPRSLSTRTYR